MIPQLLKDAAYGWFIAQQIGELIHHNQVRPFIKFNYISQVSQSGFPTWKGEVFGWWPSHTWIVAHDSLRKIRQLEGLTVCSRNPIEIRIIFAVVDEMGDQARLTDTATVVEN